MTDETNADVIVARRLLDTLLYGTDDAKHWRDNIKPQIKRARIDGVTELEIVRLIELAIDMWAADNSGEPERLPGPRLRAMLDAAP